MSDEAAGMAAFLLVVGIHLLFKYIVPAALRMISVGFINPVMNLRILSV